MDTSTRRRRIPKQEVAAALAKGKKWCPRCKRFKLLSLFHPRQERDGRATFAPYCKKCAVQRMAEEAIARRGMNDTTISERWHAKVNKQPGDGCWLWTGCMCKTTGQGKITYNGSPSFTAHRIGLMLYCKEVPRRDKVTSTCGTRGCVRPEHWKVKGEVNRAVAARKGLSTNKSALGRHRAAQSRMLARAEAALPTGLPAEVRDEMRQELVLSLLCGRRTEIGKVTPAKARAALNLGWLGAFGDPRRLSLDEPIAVEDESEITFADVQIDTSIFSDPAALAEVSRRIETAGAD